MIDQLVASETGRYIAGIVGSILSLQYASSSAKWYERLLMSATGLSGAIYLAPAAQHYLNLTDEYTLGMAFVIGMYGWSLTGGVFKIIQSKEIHEAIINRVRGKK